MSQCFTTPFHQSQTEKILIFIKIMHIIYTSYTPNAYVHSFCQFVTHLNANTHLYLFICVKLPVFCMEFGVRGPIKVVFVSRN